MTTKVNFAPCGSKIRERWMVQVHLCPAARAMRAAVSVVNVAPAHGLLQRGGILVGTYFRARLSNPRLVQCVLAGGSVDLQSTFKKKAKLT